MDEWATNVNIFPNPVNRGERFSLGMTDDMKGRVQVEIVNSLGQVVETQNLASPQDLAVPKVAGVYTLRITTEGKGTCFRKLVVK
ncbi:MAG: T9SS type A sorting domain-containing protein [Bacteroidales bacterium]|nr:T9SS type A sorting domain-containing protein [Bacteroidales bacterium]